MSLRGVIWDMDGVLVDTGEFHYLAWAEKLGENNIPFSREIFEHTFGMNNWGVLTTVLGNRPDEQLYDRLSGEKEAHFRELIDGKASPLPGVVETLGLLKSKGLRQAIASSAPQENIDFLLDVLHLRVYFDAVVSGFLLNGKPAPDVFLAAARAIDLPPQDCIVIEDAVAGVEGARRAGMLCLAVTNTNPAEKLQRANTIVDSLLEIKPDYFDRLME